MSRPIPRIVAIAIALLTLATLHRPAHGEEMPAEYAEVLAYLGRSGDFKEKVLKVNIPRNDLKVTVDGITAPTPFGFGGWLGMTRGDKCLEVMMGDLVLLEDEVNPVISALLDNGIEVTALHNHFFWEEPRIFYLHVHGHGRAADLARNVKPALEMIGKIKPRSGTMTGKQAAQDGKLDAAKLARIIGRPLEQAGSVYKVTIGRDDIAVSEMGAVINARMGLNTWAAFIGSDESAAIAGDVAMLEDEVTPVVKALRASGLNVVAIHHHMTGSRPVIIFLHYWGKGPAEKLATGFKAALNELGKGKNTLSGAWLIRRIFPWPMPTMEPLSGRITLISARIPSMKRA